MNTLMKVISILIILEGIAFLIWPVALTTVMRFFAKAGTWPFAGIIKAFFGILFLIAATSCKKPAIVITYGLLLLAGGIFIFAMGKERTKNMINYFANWSDFKVRMLAVLEIFLGALLLWAV
jgi:uncharacterized protein YjeT (DUF2065 family)